MKLSRDLIEGKLGKQTLLIKTKIFLLKNVILQTFERHCIYQYSTNKIYRETISGHTQVSSWNIWNIDKYFGYFGSLLHLAHIQISSEIEVLCT